MGKWHVVCLNALPINQQVVDRMRDVLTEHQEEPVSLAVGGQPSELEGGVAQFQADLEYDLPS